MSSNIARIRRWCLMGALAVPSPVWAASAPTLGLPLRLPGGRVPANPFPIETPHWPTSPFPVQVAPAVLPALLPRVGAPVSLVAPAAPVAAVTRVSLPGSARTLAEARSPEKVIEALRESLGMRREGSRPQPARLGSAFDGSETPAPDAPAVDARPEGTRPKPERRDDAKPETKPAPPSRPYTLPEDDLMRELGLGDWR